MPNLFRLLAFALLIGGLLTLAAAAASGEDPPCSTRRFDGSALTVCAYHPDRDRLTLRLGDGGFAGLERALGPQASRVRFALNGGMYDKARRPVGLLIVDGRTVGEVNLSDGSGNFFLRPNGVFWIDRQGGAHIDESADYAARHAGKAVFATQSGPLLLHGGALHPAVAPDGASRYIRNGVCTAENGGAAFFVISNGDISFGRLSRFMRDALHCRDALYLDGAVSSLWAPSLGRREGRTGLGPLIVVSR